MEIQKNYVNSQWIAAQSEDKIEVLNPATEEVIARVAKSNHQDVDVAVTSARNAFKDWSSLSVEERKEFVDKIRIGLENHREELAQVISQELGAPIAFARTGQVDLAITEITATLEEIDNYVFEEVVDGALVMKEPFGVVACITPWNYPLNQIQRKITPALLAGNTVVVKPASDTPLTALKFAEIVDQAGLPKGVFNVITGTGSEAGDYLASHPDVQVISFTGSTEVGRGLYSNASETIKKLVLELGGKSAMVFLDGGDLAYAVKRAMGTIIYNQGQTCSALSRLLVPKSRLKEAEALIQSYYQEKVVLGDPTDEETVVGPMVSKQQKERVLEYIQTGINEGARILVGGQLVDRKGFYVQPTVFVNVDNQMTIAQEEIFGPVLCVIGYDTMDEAIEIANDSPYGLSGAVVGPDDQAIKVARAMRTGNVFVNRGPRSAKAPFGGYKQSGLGRENGVYGLEDYLEIKAIFVESSDK